MPTHLRVLIIEDSPADAALATREIMRVHPDAECLIVDSLAELDRVLESHDFDLVLSDYELQGFNALDNLERVRSRRLPVPFVVMSGTIGEERAVQLMKAGVTDYLMKENLSRLVPIVDRAVREARERAQLETAERQLLEAAVEWRETFNAISDAILTLDSDGRIVRMNGAATEVLGLDPVTDLGTTCAAVLARLLPSTTDDACEAHLADEHVRFELGPCADQARWFRVTSDPLRAPSGAASGHVVVFSDITRRKQAEAEQAALLARLERTMNGTVTIAVHMVESRDPYTAGHQEAVAEYALDIARKLGIQGSDLSVVRTAALLHDIGKISIPSEILVRTGKLQELEWMMIRRHPEVGAEILEGAAFDDQVQQIVLQHHERLDGSGYPSGLTGDDILFEAKIVAVADVTEAMLAHRPYRAAKSYEETIEELTSGRGVLYDPQAVDACLGVLEDRFANA